MSDSSDWSDKSDKSDWSDWSDWSDKCEKSQYLQISLPFLSVSMTVRPTFPKKTRSVMAW